MTRLICGSIGPRVGNSGTPRCAQAHGHPGAHRGYPGSGFERIDWWDISMESWDLEFAADWERHLRERLEEWCPT